MRLGSIVTWHHINGGYTLLGWGGGILNLRRGRLVVGCLGVIVPWVLVCILINPWSSAITTPVAKNATIKAFSRKATSVLGVSVVGVPIKVIKSGSVASIVTKLSVGVVSVVVVRLVRGPIIL